MFSPEYQNLISIIISFMLSRIEFFMESIFLNILNKKISFNFGYALLDLLKNPQNQSIIAIIKFYNKSHTLMEEETNKIITFSEELLNSKLQYSFQATALKILSSYKYEFNGLNNLTVNSNMFFLLIKSMEVKDLSNLIEYISINKLTKILQCPEIVHNSYIYSTVIHELIKKKQDKLVFHCAEMLDDKTLLFTKNAEGDTPLEIALEYNCNLSFEYLDKLKELRERLNI